MRIESIRLINFRSYADVTFKFTEPRTLLIGQTGAGKSTVFDAIEWVLDGQCRGIDGRGQGREDLINEEADGTTVELKIADWKKPIRRTLTRSGNTTASADPKAIQAKLGVSRGMLRAVLRGGEFFKMHHAEASALLLGALDVRVDLSKHLPADDPILDGIDEPVTLEELKKLYDVAFTDRAAAKKRLAEHYVPEPVKVVNIDDRKLLGLTVEEASAALKMRRAELQAARSAADEIGGRISELRKSEGRQIETLKGKDVAGVKGRLESHRDMLAKEEASRGSAESAIREFDAAGGDSPTDLSRERQNLQALVDRIANHDPSGGCVLNRSIPCLTEGAAFKGEITKLSEAIKGLDGKIGAAQQRERERGALNQRVSDVAKDVTYHTTQITNLENEISRLESATAELDRVRGEMAGLLSQDADARAEVARLEPLVVEQEQLVDGVRAHLEGTSARDRALERRVQVEDEVARLEQAVQVLGPTGARAAALTAALEEFLAAVNLGLGPMGKNLTIEAEPWNVAVNNRSWEVLSTGEQIMVGAAMQQVLAIQSGLDLIVVDGAESATGDARQALTDLFMLSPVSQVLLAMGRGPKDPPVTPWEGLQVIGIGPQAVAVTG
jgi:DNA repair exonuclease SbcCD ATPase subunit